MHEEEKELATDRLLEVLRADVEEEVEVNLEDKNVSVPLSDKEVQAILATKDSKKEEKKKRGFSIPKQKIDYKKFLNFAISKLKRLVIEKDGYIGLDIGNNNIKYVILKHSGKDVILEGYGIHPYRTGNLNQEKVQEELLHTLSLAITSDKKKLYNIVTSVFGQKVAIKNVTLPKVAKAELRDAIIWNAKKDLPFPIEQSMVDYKILGEVSEKGVPKLSSVVAIADQEIIQTHLEQLKKTDTIPTRVIIVPLAIYNAFYFFTEKSQIKNGVVIDIGSSNTYMIFISEGNLQFAREIGIGGEDVTKGLIGSISTDVGVVNIDREFAEKLKTDVGIADENDFALYKEGISNSQAGMMMKPTLEKLASQIQRTFDYYRSKFPKSEPEKVYISGGTAAMNNFTPFLTEALGREVIVLNPFEYVKVSDKITNKEDLDKAVPFLSVAFGNAIDEKRGLNLLPPEIQIIPLLNFQKRIFIRAY
ncbi:type IV pilus assembly protein PilM [candidate division KSB1 bacterium]